MEAHGIMQNEHSVMHRIVMKRIKNKSIKTPQKLKTRQNTPKVQKKSITKGQKAPKLLKKSKTNAPKLIEENHSQTPKLHQTLVKK